MRFAKQSKGKKNIAVLLVVAMLLTIMPVAAFAVDEGPVVKVTTPKAEVTTGSVFTVTASVTTGSAITTPSMIWYVPTEDGDTTKEPQSLEGQKTGYSVDRSFSYNTAGKYTIGAEFFDGETSLGRADVTVTVKTPVEGVITEDMTQDDIDKVVAESDVITVEEGDYGFGTEKKHAKINLTKGNQVVNISGEYNRLMIVVLSEGNTINSDSAIIKGDLSTVDNQSPAIYIPHGDVTLNGSLIMDDHDYGVILGYTNATINNSSKLTLAENATLTINNCQKASNSFYDNGVVCAGTDYFSNVDGQGDGTRGSAIVCKGRGTIKIDLENGSEISASNCYSAGMFFISATDIQINLDNAKIDFQNNNQGINMNTTDGINGNRYVEKFTANISNNSVVNCAKNKSNGFTGQAKNEDHPYIKPYLLNISNGSEVNASNNGGIGINNFFIIIKNSTLNGNNNNSHGITNVSMDADNSVVVCNENRYLGLNITRVNEGEDTTNIVGHTTINANNNGGAGIRFYNTVIPENDRYGTIISNSTIIAQDNGYLSEKISWSDQYYGFINAPSDSGAFAGIVGKANILAENSVIMSDSAAGYALYDTSVAPAALYISGSDVAVFNGDAGMSNVDIFDDFNDGMKNTGRTYVTGGSLQAELVKMHGNDKYGKVEENEFPWNTEIVVSNTGGVSGAKDTYQYAGPVNNEGTMLVRFDLHNEVNKEVGLQSKQAKQIDKSFTYYDPNTNNKAEYNYQFRFNNEGEDLVAGESGNAYVWTPVSVLHYDATEGTISDLGTAGVLTVGDSITSQDGNAGLNTRYTQDVTIYGNSLNLAERTMPTAEKANAIFRGWFVAADESGALKDVSALANENKFAGKDGLYAQLNVPFDQTTKVVDQFETSVNPDNSANVYTATPEAAIEEITIYAKWAAAKIEGVVFHDNEKLQDNLYNGKDDTVFAGETVYLKDANGNVVQETTTDVNGHYEFYLDSVTDQTNGDTYTVELAKYPGENMKICAVVDAERGNKFAGTTATAKVTVKQGTTTTANAGFYQAGAIEGYVFNDVEVEKQRDNIYVAADDTELADVKVSLYQMYSDSNNYFLVGETKTDENGYYKFDNLIPDGKYFVYVERPTAYNRNCDYAYTDSQIDGDRFKASAVVTGENGNALYCSDIITVVANETARANAGFYHVSSSGPDPEKPSNPDPVDPPEEEIPDPDVPLVEPEDPTTEIDEPDVPLVEPGTPVEEIDEPEVPLGDAPKTGDAAPIVGLIGLLVVAVAGLVVVRRKFN